MIKFTPRQFVAVSLWIALAAVSVVTASPARVGEWVVIAPSGEGFSVKLPVKPSEETDRIALVGNTYLLRLYTSTDTQSGLLYMVLMQEFPSMVTVLEPAARLEKFVEGFKTGFGEALGKSQGLKFDLLADRDLNLAGHVGRQYKLTVGESQGLMRVYDGQRRVYFLLVLGANEKNADVNRFFNSFEMKAAPDPVPQPVVEPKSSSLN